MKKTTKYRRNGIQWTPWSQLEDLDFADDLALLSHSHQQMQENTELLNTVSTQLGLNINRSKTRIMKANTKNNNPITMNGEPLEETDSFTCKQTIHNQQTWRHSRRRQSKDTESKSCIHHVEK